VPTPLPDHPTNAGPRVEPAAEATPSRHLRAVDATTLEPIEDATEEEVNRLADVLRWVIRATAWMRTNFTPDSGLYADRQPSIEEIVRRAKGSDHLPDEGILRRLAIGYSYLAAANKAAAVTWAWIVDHPARLFVVGVLLALAMVFPPTRYAIAALLTPLTWIQQALD
jgi:hypothetical protein